MGRLDQTSMVPSARSHLGSCTRKRQACFKRARHRYLPHACEAWRVRSGRWCWWRDKT